MFNLKILGDFGISLHENQLGGQNEQILCKIQLFSPGAQNLEHPVLTIKIFFQKNKNDNL